MSAPAINGHHYPAAIEGPSDRLRDHVAERQLVAAALHGHVDQVLAVDADAFDHWQYAAIAAAIRRLHARGVPFDAPLIMREVVNNAGGDSQAQKMGALVAELALVAVPSDAAQHYAERVQEMSVARRLTVSTEAFQRKVTYAVENGDDEAMTGAVTAMREAIAAAEVAFKPVPAEPPMSLAALLDEHDEAYDWLVPDLLERTDRLILTGFEGTGKSYLLAQMALCIAAGIHPFTGEPLAGLDGGTYRALVFDCENSKRQMRRRYRRIADQVQTLRKRHDLPPVDWNVAVRIVSRPEGVALTEPRELARIEQNVALTAPDLVVAGPLYKMSKLDVKDEQAAKELTDTLDLLRIRHQFTLIAEAHAGHSNDGGGQRRVRPIGSSLFLRWPEFGFGIAPSKASAGQEHPSMVDVRHWRGSRDERQWPTGLVHGDRLPWEPNGEYWDMLTHWERAA